MSHVVVATGTKREAVTLRHTGLVVIAAGGDAECLQARLVTAARNATGIISFGMAGALAEDLSIGDWIIGARLSGATGSICDPAWRDRLLATLPGARAGTVYADGRMIDTIAEKRLLGEQHRALAVDMESHVAAAVAAAQGLPFAIARCISDGADRVLPHAITVAMRPDGSLDATAMLCSLARHPGQIMQIAGTTAGFARAMRELKRGAARLGPAMAFDQGDTIPAAS